MRKKSDLPKLYYIVRYILRSDDSAKFKETKYKRKVYSSFKTATRTENQKGPFSIDSLKIKMASKKIKSKESLLKLDLLSEFCLLLK